MTSAQAHFTLTRLLITIITVSSKSVYLLDRFSVLSDAVFILTLKPLWSSLHHFWSGIIDICSLNWSFTCDYLSYFYILANCIVFEKDFFYSCFPNETTANARGKQMKSNSMCSLCRSSRANLPLSFLFHFYCRRWQTWRRQICKTSKNVEDGKRSETRERSGQFDESNCVVQSN